MNVKYVRCLAVCLLFCLLTVLSACSMVVDGESSHAGADEPTTTAMQHIPPQPDDVVIEINGAVIGNSYLAEGTRYLKADNLADALDLRSIAPDAETLRLTLDGQPLTFHAESNLAEWSNGDSSLLSADVLHEEDGWYLPVSVLEEILGRKNVYDSETRILRSFMVASGPVLRWNGADETKTLRMGGVVAVSAAEFATALNATVEAGTQDANAVSLIILVGDNTMTFREGAMSAELNGEVIDLPAPACTIEDSWYLPINIAECFGCYIQERIDDDDAMDLWSYASGERFWFNGMAMGESILCGGIHCTTLSRLTESLGGDMAQTEDGYVVTAGSHTLAFRVGSEIAEVDGESVALPLPVITQPTDCIVAIPPIAEALGLHAMDDNPLVYSRIESRDTELWIDGQKMSSFAFGGDGLYFNLGSTLVDVEKFSGAGDNGFEFTVFGKHVIFSGGSCSVQIDETSINLSNPVCNDGGVWYAPTELLTVVGFTELVDPDLDQIYYTRIVPNDTLSEGHRVPVLMYHAVSDKIWGIPELFISPSTLDAQIQALIENGYTAITFEDLDRIDEIEKPVMLTFDDGYDDNYTELFPILKKYNVKATVFVIVNDLGKNHKLTKEQVKEMSDSGLVSIQSHTMSHNYLDGMSESSLIREHYNSMIELARITGKQPFVMCYPTGKSSGYSRNITAQYYEYGLCMSGPCWVTGEAPYRIYRYYIPRNTSLSTFLAYLAG